jgi:hypothetical protein
VRKVVKIFTFKKKHLTSKVVHQRKHWRFRIWRRNAGKAIQTAVTSGLKTGFTTMNEYLDDHFNGAGNEYNGPHAKFFVRALIIAFGLFLTLMFLVFTLATYL